MGRVRREYLLEFWQYVNQKHLVGMGRNFQRVHLHIFLYAGLDLVLNKW